MYSTAWIRFSRIWSNNSVCIDNQCTQILTVSAFVCCNSQTGFAPTVKFTVKLGYILAQQPPVCYSNYCSLRTTYTHSAQEWQTFKLQAARCDELAVSRRDLSLPRRRSTFFQVLLMATRCDDTKFNGCRTACNITQLNELLYIFVIFSEF